MPRKLPRKLRDELLAQTSIDAAMGLVDPVRERKAGVQENVTMRELFDELKVGAPGVTLIPVRSTGHA